MGLGTFRVTPERLTTATDTELAALSDLCLRSKAHWGYDKGFMDACRDVLTVRAEDLSHPMAVVRTEDGFAGIVRLDLSKPEPELSKLFVCPDHMGKGVGSCLIIWAKNEARAGGHDWLRVESDPEAAPFYESHGAIRVGVVPSEAIPNRVLPLLKLPTVQT